MIDLCSAATFDRARPDFPEDKVFVLTVANTEPQSSETGPAIPVCSRPKTRAGQGLAAARCLTMPGVHWRSSLQRTSLNPGTFDSHIQKIFPSKKNLFKRRTREKSTQLPRKSAER
jgi:hypothetical protein